MDGGFALIGRREPIPGGCGRNILLLTPAQGEPAVHYPPKNATATSRSG